jgi:CHAT domain-containing protein
VPPASCPNIAFCISVPMAIAGEFGDLAEPAFVLSPPDTASEEDDGLLAASEVAGLKLDADWVILSAGNTLAGDQSNAEALWGLARAFFYAGAWALLVSHWPVDSGAAAKLTTAAFQELRKVEAAGKSMGADRHRFGARGAPHDRAPFGLVGEGGAGR